MIVFFTFLDMFSFGRKYETKNMALFLYKKWPNHKPEKLTCCWRVLCCIMDGDTVSTLYLYFFSITENMQHYAQLQCKKSIVKVKIVVGIMLYLTKSIPELVLLSNLKKVRWNCNGSRFTVVLNIIKHACDPCKFFCTYLSMLIC